MEEILSVNAIQCPGAALLSRKDTVPALILSFVRATDNAISMHNVALCPANENGKCHHPKGSNTDNKRPDCTFSGLKHVEL